MEEIKLSEKQLKSGEVLVFSNEAFQESIGQDDIRIARILHENDPTFPGFKIWFNGKIIHSSKSFTSLQNRFNKLVAAWKLSPAENIEEET